MDCWLQVQGRPWHDNQHLLDEQVQEESQAVHKFLLGHFSQVDASAMPLNGECRGVSK